MSPDIASISPQFYGLTMIPHSAWKDYGCALLTIAGSDGEVSAPELEWLIEDMASVCGVDEAIIADWKNFNAEEASLEEIFYSFNTKSFVNFNKILIYDAIRMSRADGEYAQDERMQVHNAAKLLKVPTETVLAIESLVDIEHAAEKLRMTIF